MTEFLKHLTPIGWTVLICLVAGFALVIITLAVTMFVLAGKNRFKND